MQAILDNPIWNAVITGNKSFATGTSKAKYLDRNMSIFSAMPVYDDEHFAELASLTPSGTTTALFTADRIDIPAGWATIAARPILQMDYNGPMPPEEDVFNLISLQDQHIPAMTALTHLTKPGPWLHRTIDFGHFEGIFVQDQLVAMCGQRLQPDPYSELSGVCVHPDYLGKGYAKKLIRNQLRHIIRANRIPMLHLYADNVSACKTYESVGFGIRREMMVYVIKRN